MSNKFYIQFNPDGNLIARFDGNKSYLPHPTGTVEVDEELWHQTYRETDGVWMRDSTSGNIIKHPIPLLPLASIQKGGIRKVDNDAEVARMQFITPGSGQALIYEFKRMEAVMYLAETNPNATGYPLINERATRKGMLLIDVAKEWQAKSEAWMVIAVQIESLREGAKDVIDDVADDENAQANIDVIVDGINWPKPAA